jgi:hypothetical protein
LYTVQSVLAAADPCAPAGPHHGLDGCKIAVRRDRPVARLQCAVIMPCFSRADCDTLELFGAFPTCVDKHELHDEIKKLLKIFAVLLKILNL